MKQAVAIVAMIFMVARQSYASGVTPVVFEEHYTADKAVPIGGGNVVLGCMTTDGRREAHADSLFLYAPKADSLTVIIAMLAVDKAYGAQAVYLLSPSSGGWQHLVIPTAHPTAIARYSAVGLAVLAQVDSDRKLVGPAMVLPASWGLPGKQDSVVVLVRSGAAVTELGIGDPSERSRTPCITLTPTAVGGRGVVGYNLSCGFAMERRGSIMEVAVLRSAPWMQNSPIPIRVAIPADTAP